MSTHAPDLIDYHVSPPSPTPPPTQYTPPPPPPPPPLPTRLATLHDRELAHLRLQASTVKSLIRDSTKLIHHLSELKLHQPASADLERAERQLEANLAREFQLHGYVESVDLIREQRRVRRLLQHGAEGADREFEVLVRAITDGVCREMERFNRALGDSRLRLRGVPGFGAVRWNLEVGGPRPREDGGVARD